MRADVSTERRLVDDTKYVPFGQDIGTPLRAFIFVAERQGKD